MKKCPDRLQQLALVGNFDDGLLVVHALAYNMVLVHRYAVNNKHEMKQNYSNDII